MKFFFLFPAIFLSFISCNNISEPVTRDMTNGSAQPIDTSDMTNNFYDNTTTHSLPVKDLDIEGEIANPGKVDFSVLPVHSVIVKETLLDSAGGDRFVGAYRYDGYSLFDILNRSIIKKANSDEFNPIIDLFVEIENERGEKVVFSWGEIYYPNILHNIIIASAVSRIVPSKTKDLWPLPLESKIVAGGDLITERNISSPVRITVRSFPRSFTVNRNLSPLYSSKISLYNYSRETGVIDRMPDELHPLTYNTIFYGRGRGIHSTSPFTGIPLKDIIRSFFPAGRDALQSGIMCIAAADGYRCAVSYSELFNRNDQQEFLLVRTDEGEDGGLFRIFPASDFFSDRAIKSVNEIDLGY